MANDKISLNALIEEAEAAKLSLNAYLLPQSAAELEITEEELLAKMAQMLKVMEEAAAYGLTGVRSHSGLTGGSALKLQNAAAQPGFNKLLGALATDAVTYALAVSECNAAMGRIVAAPTAGAAGVLPGVLLALKKHCNLTEEQLARALVVAGQIGLVQPVPRLRVRLAAARQNAAVRRPWRQARLLTLWAALLRRQELP